MLRRPTWSPLPARVAILGVGLTAAMLITGCLNAPPTQRVQMSEIATDGTAVLVLSGYPISGIDADPGAGWLWQVELQDVGTTHHPYRLRFAGPRLSADAPGGSLLGPAGVDPAVATSHTTGIGDIDHRAVGQSGAEIVDETTGAALCAGTGDPTDSFSIDHYWAPPDNLHLALSLHCVDRRGATNDLVAPATGRLDFGSYGAV